MNGVELLTPGKGDDSSPSSSPEKLRDDDSSEAAAASQNDKPTKPLSPIQQRWRNLSLFWRKLILVSVFLFMAIIATIIIVLAVVLGPRAKAEKQNRPAIAGDGQTDNVTASEFSDYPVKLGLLTNFPDPSLYYDAPSQTWYAYGTNQAAGILDLDRTASDLSHLQRGNIQLAKSTDFITWRLVDRTADPLPQPGAWTKQGTTDLSSLPYHDDGLKPNASDKDISLPVARADVWAPELLHRQSDGKWVLYYTAANQTGGVHCLGAGVSSSPGGPFTSGDEAFICPGKQGGAIDPSVFVDTTDNNAIYLAYKVNGNVRGHGGECNNMKEPIVPTPIKLQRMQDDGITIDTTFEPQTILDRIAEDGPLIEAPSLIKADDHYFLFYSSGCTTRSDYALRYAYASEIGGPYTRAKGALVKTGDFGLDAPGSATIRFGQNVAGESPEGTTGTQGATQANGISGSWKIAMHGRVNTTIGGVRALFTVGIEIDGTNVKLVDGSTSVT